MDKNLVIDDDKELCALIKRIVLHFPASCAAGALEGGWAYLNCISFGNKEASEKLCESGAFPAFIGKRGKHDAKSQ